MDRPRRNLSGPSAGAERDQAAKPAAIGGGFPVYRIYLSFHLIPWRSSKPEASRCMASKTVPFKELRGETAAEPSAEIRERVERGRAVQQGFTIADAIATVPEGVDDSGERTLEMAFGRMGLSARTDSESGADSGGPRRRGARFGQARRGSGAVPDLDRNLELAESRDGCELGRARRRHPRVRTQSARQTATAEAAWLCR